MLQTLAPRRTPLNQSKVPAKATTAPTMENPTIASRTLRRIDINALQVALAREDYRYGTVQHKDYPSYRSLL